VSASFCAERGRGTKESGGGHLPLLTERKRGKWGGGSGEGGATWRKEGGLGAVTPCGRGWRGGASDGVQTGGSCGKPAAAGAGRCCGAREQGNGVAHVGCV
jgi:hypothetical protein